MKTITNITYATFALFMLGCFALSPQAGATCQDACLTNSNTVQGNDALIFNTTGFQNTATGFNALYSNTTGYDNTAVGFWALHNNMTGYANTAIGNLAFNDGNGNSNTAIGAAALFSINGDNNTATGFSALGNPSGEGNYNTADGVLALSSDVTGDQNTATGFQALSSNQGGSSNTASGSEALFYNISGNYNTASGYNALYGHYSTGNDNTATGVSALLNNTTGNSNIALGNSAGQNLTTGSNNIDIGNLGVAGDSKTIRIGTAATQRETFIAGISGATVASGVGVIVGSNGQLGTVVSSERFKDAIKPMDKASEAILALQPVTFRYKHELDPDGIPQFGLVAEQVEKVNPDLVARDERGKPYTVRYEAVNAMLLNELLKEHKAFLEEHRSVEELKKQVAALTMGLQKVNAQLEVTKPAPQMVNNP